VRIRVNEREVDIPEGTTLHGVRAQQKPGADVLVVNGAPALTDRALHEGDSVVLIVRGEVPSSGELESLMAARHTPGVHAKMKSATVGIAGLGGLGSNIAAALGRIGVGRLVLADFDVVEPSNLNRQSYFVEQIGMRKTDATRENLRRINPYVNLETHFVRLDGTSVPEVFGAVDVMVEAFDTPQGKAMLAELYHGVFPGRPLVMASGMAGYYPGNSVRVQRLGTNLWVVGDLEHAAAPGVGLMAPRVSIAAAQQANLVVRILLGEAGEQDME